MKRSVTDILRRGFDNTIANWPLIVLRIVESIVLFAIVIASLIAAIVPIVGFAALKEFNADNPEEAIRSLGATLIEQWALLLFVLIVLAVVLAVVIAIHAFVEGGTARVLVDGERGPIRPGFTLDRWLAGGRASWWNIFWIYNIVWTIAAVVILLPLMFIAGAMIIVPGDAARIVVGCAGLAAIFLLLIPIAIVAGVWSQKAIAVSVARSLPARESLRVARLEIFGDFGRHAIVAIVIFAISFGGVAVISVLFSPFTMFQHQQPGIALLFAPVQIVSSFAQSIFSSAVGIWFLASYIALGEDR